MVTTFHETHATLPTFEAFDPRAELDAWGDYITEMDRAMRDASEARLALDSLALQLERLEAEHALEGEGRNAEERRARLVLALADDPHHQRARTAHHDARRHLLDAERRVQISRERCRLLRTALSLRAVND